MDDPELPSAERFVATLPSGWHRVAAGPWMFCTPPLVELPSQGWKAHVSTRLDHADDILREVVAYCGTTGLTFKHLRDRTTLLLHNSKSADRQSSGKFIAIYPTDERELVAIVDDLAPALASYEGPAILSDLRIGTTPLHVRYGSFERRWCEDDAGHRVLALADPAGQLVPDIRGPTFAPPVWVDLPAVLGPSLAARRVRTLDELPYAIERALHFSNAGGIYLARDRRDGRLVVLKEARPHAGLSGDGADAVTRLGRERAALERLAGLSAVPQLLDHFSFDGHHFLVLEYIDGPPLRSELVHRYPLTSHAPTEVSIREYTAWALEVTGRVGVALATVHERGVAIRDLSPANVLIRPDRVVLVDWEVATFDDERPAGALTTPGFTAPPGLDGPAADRYALERLELAMFMPLTRVADIQQGKVGDLVGEVAHHFTVPEGLFGSAGRATTSRAAALLREEPTDWPRLRDAMVTAILASATPDRTDRLFPGDMAPFDGVGGMNLAHGAAGVLHALHAVGATPPIEHVDWLVHAAEVAPRDTPIGLVDGLLGVALVLDDLGHQRAATQVVERCLAALESPTLDLGLDLAGGWTGIALALERLATRPGRASLGDGAAAASERVADRIERMRGVGLLRGGAGAALLFVTRFERTGDAGWLDVAARVLRRELERCITTADGALHVDEGWRTVPYVATGSAGVGLALARFLDHRHDERFADATEAIRLATAAQLYALPGLFNGLAGMILTRHALGSNDAVLAAQVRRLARYVLLDDPSGGIAFPNDRLERPSMDLASGTAGALFALAATLGDYPLLVPFLDRGPART